MISENELKSLIKLNEFVHGNIEFLNADDKRIEEFIIGISFEQVSMTEKCMMNVNKKKGWSLW